MQKKTYDEVRDAFKAGKIDEQTARQLLYKRCGKTDTKSIDSLIRSWKKARS